MVTNLFNVVVVAVVWSGLGVFADEFEDKLKAADTAAVEVLNNIFTTWEVDKYPGFLKSAWMPRHSWDHLVAKFEQRILEAHDSKKTKNFTVSFTGSSVTAGHDSPFKLSFPVLFGELTKAAFVPLDINLVSNNDAMGNNPCMPYDACVATYSGPNADIVHWEQQYNCFIDGDPRMVEQFIRQAAYMPLNPIVIIGGSVTPNWHPPDCKNIVPHVITPSENELLTQAKLGPEGVMKIYTELNKNERGQISQFHGLLKNYPSAGLQNFDHATYEQYKCQGPYIPTWGDGCASWHPSVSGHKLRAHHHAYPWVSAYHMAVQKVLTAYKKGDKVKDMLASVTTFLDNLKPKFPLPAPLSKSQTVSDNVQCFTAFEPHQDRERSLTPIIINGLHSDTYPTGWMVTQLEALLDNSIVVNAQKQGYLDLKIIYYGNKGSGPISLKVTVKNDGLFYICEAPGVWGKLPTGFVHLWESGMKVYMTPVKTAVGFKFTEDPKHEVKTVRKDSDEICTHIETPMARGSYVLTIVPTTDDKIALSTLLIP